MPGEAQTIPLGAGTATIIDVYDIPTRLKELIVPPPGEADDLSQLDVTVNLAVQCVLVQLPGLTVLVDAGAYDESHDASERAGYQPRPNLLDQLAAMGVAPENVDHVVITHLHGDHYNGTTIVRDGFPRLAFPNAQYYVGRADWEAPGLHEALEKPTTMEGRSLGVVAREGRLVPVAGELELGRDVQICSVPGETPGHQVLRVCSEGQTLYCVGDLYHHPVEVGHPTWMPPWADRETNHASRRSLAEAAVAEDAYLVATHIRGAGRLAATESGVTWAWV